MSKFNVFRGSNQLYYFHLKADNGEKVLASEGYFYKEGCLNGIASVKTNCTDDSKYEKRTSVSGSYYFNLKAGNNQIIGTSEMYNSSQGRDIGIIVIKRLAPTAVIEDDTVLSTSYR